jgi:hypothetical protein
MLSNRLNKSFERGLTEQQLLQVCCKLIFD